MRRRVALTAVSVLMSQETFRVLEYLREWWRDTNDGPLVTMLRDALDSFVRRDLDLAQHVLDEDDRLDALKTQIFRELLTYMLNDPATIEPALDLILISRHLERIGDHATNVAEDVIFMPSSFISSRFFERGTALRSLKNMATTLGD